MISPDALTDAAVLEQLRPRLMALPARSLRPVFADPSVATSKVFGVVARLREDPELVARFRRLPPEELDPAYLELLEPAARAVAHTQSTLRTRTRTRRPARLAPDVVRRGRDLKERLLRILEYRLGERADLAPVLARVRSGTGHLDLASDLLILSVLLQRHLPALAGDPLLRAEDAAEAEATSNEIRSAVAGPATDPHLAERDLAVRAWTLMVEVYEEIQAAGRWLLRKSDGKEAFPSLGTGGRNAKKARRRPSKAAATPG